MAHLFIYPQSLRSTSWDFLSLFGSFLKREFKILDLCIAEFHFWIRRRQEFPECSLNILEEIYHGDSRMDSSCNCNLPRYSHFSGQWQYWKKEAITSYSNNPPGFFRWGLYISSVISSMKFFVCGCFHAARKNLTASLSFCIAWLHYQNYTCWRNLYWTTDLMKNFLLDKKFRLNEQWKLWLHCLQPYLFVSYISFCRMIDCRMIDWISTRWIGLYVVASANPNQSALWIRCQIADAHAYRLSLL